MTRPKDYEARRKAVADGRRKSDAARLAVRLTVAGERTALALETAVIRLETIVRMIEDCKLRGLAGPCFPPAAPKAADLPGREPAAGGASFPFPNVPPERPGSITTFTVDGEFMAKVDRWGEAMRKAITRLAELEEHNGQGADSLVEIRKGLEGAFNS